MICAQCGTTAPAGARFCAQCGRPFDRERTPAELVTVATGDDATIQPATPRPSSRGGQRPASGSSGWLTASDSISHGRFAPGAILEGRFRIIGLLGQGGMGAVYRADDLRLGQPVALKFLPDAVAADAVRLAQFHNEVRTARQISHPNICRVYDIGEIDGHLFLSMELVDGEDLASSLRRIGRFPEDKATDIARQLCAGLAAAHDKGVLHRDLKPANVMLDGAGKVRLMDFGLAAIGAVEDVRAGTPAYMAPEQLLGREVTARSDIYALGLVLYELFTGRRTFTAATLNELVEQHQSGTIAPPRSIVPALDPSIDGAILRCLDPDPARRPASALAVSAALPGGDPLAAALAAGETPSPQMVAAAGEGAGLKMRVALPVFIAVLAGMAAVYAMALRTSALERMRPELTSDVLAQKAREAVRQLGYVDRPADEAYGLEWNDSLAVHIVRRKAPPVQWDQTLTGRPAALEFWYRQGPQPLTGLSFHHDLLTPGIVDKADPPPIESGMIQLTLDRLGFLTAFEAIPAQVDASASPGDQAPAVDWKPVLALAGLDPNSLQPATPQWHWLSSPDTRAAWTGQWPGDTLPLRVEAAALRGRIVAMQLSGPWTTPSRTPEATTGQQTIFLAILFAMALAILVGGGLLARRNLREGRGDRAGARALAGFVVCALWVLWVCQVHVSGSLGLFANFLLAVCTTVFYGVLFWAIYLALEPFVRRYWPQTLVSWTTLLSGRVRDPIVGRDVLFGLVLGVAIAILLRIGTMISGDVAATPIELLMGVRSTSGEVLMHVLYAIRSSLFVFFLLFLFRVLLRNQWLGAGVFVVLYAGLSALNSEHPLVEGLMTLLYFSMFAVAVLRWGLTTLAVGTLTADLMLIMPATASLSAWYLGSTIFLAFITIGLAIWAFVTSTAGQRSTVNWLG